MSSAPILLDVRSPFQLWLLPLTVSMTDADLALLDDREHARAARFAFERDRVRYVCAHAALRRLLADRTGVPAAALRFELGEFGKPQLRDVPGCTFSLSHSGDRALVAFADRDQIGVDLEAVHTLRDVDALAAQCLRPQERFHFEATPKSERDLAFLRAWTRKEACLKALGTGLQIAPIAVEAGLEVAERRVPVALPHEVCEVVVTSFLPAPGWVAAVAHVSARLKRGGSSAQADAVK